MERSVRPTKHKVVVPDAEAAIPLKFLGLNVRVPGRLLTLRYC